MYPLVDNARANADKSYDSIVPHSFGDHVMCVNGSWCRYKEYPSAYRHYGASSSLKSRVSAAVLQKNEGHNYLMKVNEANLLSPGLHTSNLTKKIDQRRRVKRLHQRSAQYKRRRIQLERQKKKKERVSTVREIVSYEPNLELNCISAQEEIPEFLEFDKSSELVTFDLETTGLGRNCDITQIAASAGEEVFQSYVFQSYVVPRCNITKEASKITGITYCRGSNTLYLHGKAVCGKLVNEALLDFICMARQYVENSCMKHFLILSVLCSPRKILC